jgi:transposase-like protein
MSNKRYPDEFKIEAVKQVTERGYAVADVANRIGVAQHSLYEWIKKFSLPESQRVDIPPPSGQKFRRNPCQPFQSKTCRRFRSKLGHGFQRKPCQ